MRQRGRPVHGWLIVDKPAGPSSAAVVAKARWALDARKAGHAGTLDPAATGLLAVAFGEATKTVRQASEGMKTYRFTLRWGAATDTDDAEGTVIATGETRPDAAAIRAALPAFTGDVLQVPPRVSAVKVEGRRAYDRARAGETTELAARPLHVARLELLGTPDRATAVFEMTCGKGGYVRSLGRDLGERLGCLAHVAGLRRLRAGPFDLGQAVDLETLQAEARTPAIEARLLPLTAALAGLPEVRATPEGAARLLNGNPGEAIADLDWGIDAWASHAGRPLAIGTWRGGRLHPTRVFVLD
jgi:tRNA pseudouridine55 synthase